MKLIDKIKSFFNKTKGKAKKMTNGMTDSEFADDEYLGNMNPHCAQDLKRKNVSETKRGANSKSNKNSCCKRGKAKDNNTASSSAPLGVSKNSNPDMTAKSDATKETEAAADIIPPFFTPGVTDPDMPVTLPTGNQLKSRKKTSAKCDATTSLKSPSVAESNNEPPSKCTAKRTPKTSSARSGKRTRPTNENYTMIDKKDETVDSSRS